MKSSQFSFAVSPELLAKAHQFAKERSQSLSSLIREFMKTLDTARNNESSSKPDRWCRTCDQLVQAYNEKCSICDNYVITHD
jgi:hypothetical protein